jgi:pyruvate formate lyase activating enzyme
MTRSALSGSNALKDDLPFDPADAGAYRRWDRITVRYSDQDPMGHVNNNAYGVWLEVATLVIPGVNDADHILGGIAERIVTALGPDVPWHVSGYYPAYRFTAPPTPVRTLERAWRIGRMAGLRFVYLGNVLGHRLENTHCPGCGALLVGRRGLGLTCYRLERGRCPDCGRAIPGKWG